MPDVIQLGAVLVAVDFSACSLRALDTVLHWREPGSDLTVLHVLDSQLAQRIADTGVLVYEDAIARMREVAERDIANLVTEKGQDSFESMIVEGVPFVEIIKIANDLDTDLVVMGSHGHSGVTELFFGGTAEKVLRGGRRPVLCIP